MYLPEVDVAADSSAPSSAVPACCGGAPNAGERGGLPMCRGGMPGPGRWPPAWKRAIAPCRSSSAAAAAAAAADLLVLRVLRTLDKLSTMSMFSSVPTERIGGGDGDGAASGLSAREGPVSSPRGVALCVLSGELFGLRDETDDS